MKSSHPSQKAFLALVVVIVVLVTLTLLRNTLHVDQYSLIMRGRIVDYYYNTSSPNPDDRSVLVVPRRAYYDNRTVSGKPRNMLVILTEVEDSMVNSIVACEINGYFSKEIRTNLRESIAWVRKARPGYTHCMVIVQCMGLPVESILDGSNTSIIYKKKNDPFSSRVQTEKPLFVSKSSPKKGSVMTCATIFGHPSQFKPWLKYQKMIGVDFVKLNVHSSFSDGATSLYPYLKEAIETGFVEMETWRDITDNRFYYHSKIVKYQSCLYRYKDTYEYAFFLDHDDFFNPVTPTHKDTHYHLAKFFSNKRTGAVYFMWRQMRCVPDKAKIADLEDGNLTAILTGTKASWRSETKMAVRLCAVQQVAIHTIQSLLPGYGVRYLAAGDSAYIAHNRQTTKTVCKK